MTTDTPRKLATLSVFLRIYGILTLIIFGLLFLGFMVQTPLLAEHGGVLNWTIWNDVRFGNDHAHVPPMLLLIYVVWGVFLLRAAKNPPAYSSFLDFTMWANLAHGLLMAAQVFTDVGRYWSKFLTDIPFVLILAIGIFLLRPTAKPEDVAVAQHETAGRSPIWRRSRSPRSFDDVSRRSRRD
jgi:hypothetical protein